MSSKMSLQQQQLAILKQHSALLEQQAAATAAAAAAAASDITNVNPASIVHLSLSLSPGNRKIPGAHYCVMFDLNFFEASPLLRPIVYDRLVPWYDQKTKLMKLRSSQAAKDDFMTAAGEEPDDDDDDEDMVPMEGGERRRYFSKELRVLLYGHGDDQVACQRHPLSHNPMVSKRSIS